MLFPSISLAVRTAALLVSVVTSETSSDTGQVHKQRNLTYFEYILIYREAVSAVDSGVQRVPRDLPNSAQNDERPRQLHLVYPCVLLS